MHEMATGSNLPSTTVTEKCTFLCLSNQARIKRVVFTQTYEATEMSPLVLLLY